MCARARTSVHTRSHSLPLKGLFVQLEAALLGPAMPTITHSPVKMVSAHSSSSKPQTNPLLWGILIGRLEEKKRKKIKWPMTCCRVYPVTSPSSVSAETCDMARSDSIFLSEILSERLVDGALKSIDDTWAGLTKVIYQQCWACQ